MHSSRKRTVRCSSHLRGVSAQECLPACRGGVSACQGCVPGRCLLARGYLPPKGGGICLPGRCTPSPRGQTDTCENITFPQLLLWTVKIIKKLSYVIYLQNIRTEEGGFHTQYSCFPLHTSCADPRNSMLSIQLQKRLLTNYKNALDISVLFRLTVVREFFPRHVNTISLVSTDLKDVSIRLSSLMPWFRNYNNIMKILLSIYASGLVRKHVFNFITSLKCFKCDFKHFYPKIVDGKKVAKITSIVQEIGLFTISFLYDGLEVTIPVMYVPTKTVMIVL